MRRVEVIALAAIALAGCGEREVGTVALPPLDQARGAVVALIVDGVLRETRAVDPMVTRELLFDAPAEAVARGTVIVASYSETLEQLGIPRGLLSVGPSGEPLPEPALVLSRLSPGGAWSTGQELPTALIEARFVGIGVACPSFRQTPIAFSEPSVRYAVEIAGDQVLVGLESGALVALRPGEQPRPVTTSTAIPAGIAAAVARSDGSVALIDAFCCVYDGTLSGDVITVLEPHCAASELCGIVVDAVAHRGSRGISWITYDGVLTELDGRGVFRPLGTLDEFRGPGRVVRDDTGVTYAGQLARRIAVVDSGGLRLESPPLAGEYLTALSFIDGVGLLLGDSGGHVLMRGADGDYQALGDPGFFSGATRFLSLAAERFWVIGGSGEGSVWHGRGFCPLEQVGAGVVLYSPRLADGWLLIGRTESGSPNVVGIWARPAL